MQQGKGVWPCAFRDLRNSGHGTFPATGAKQDILAGKGKHHLLYRLVYDLRELLQKPEQLPTSSDVISFAPVGK